MSKTKLFLENFIIYGIGGILGKIISFVMVPIVIRLMPNASYFGISDLSNTIVTFATYIAIFGIYDAMFRMFFDKDDVNYKRVICSTSLIFVFISTIVVCFILFIFKSYISYYVFGSDEHCILFYITIGTILVGSTNTILSAPTRMQNHKKTFLVLGLLSSILSYIITIPLLLKKYYVTALPIASLFCALFTEILFICINKTWFSVKLFNYKVLKQLLYIAIPLVPNFLIYWIFNSADKLMIQYFLGTEEVGIYSVGSKLGHLSQLIYTAFSGGWQYFSFSTMNDKNQVNTTSKVFEYLGVISFIFTAFVCVFSSLVYKMLFPIEYYRGFVISPYLFLAPLLQMLFQVIVNQFLIIKNTLPSMLILFFGAIVNVILNVFFVPMFGIEGAAITTLTGYIISLICAIVVLHKIKLVGISKKFFISSFFMLVYFIIWRVFLSYYMMYSFILWLLFFGLNLIIYKNDILLIYTCKIKNRIFKIN